METSIIEKLDIAKSSFLKWATIGWSIYFGTYIITDLFRVPELPDVLTWVRLLGWLILIVSAIRFFKLKRELKWDRKMKKALEGEFHLYNLRRSFQNGYFVVIGTTAIFFLVSLFYTVPVLLVTKVILYFGTLAVMISKIIYNRG